MNITTLGFTGNTHIQGKALIKLAKLTSGNDEQKTQEAYSKLQTLSDSLDYDLIIKLDKEDSIIVSKLNPLTKDTIEIARNHDFTQGIKEAIKIIEAEDIDLQKQFYTSDLNRYRIITQIRNIK